MIVNFRARGRFSLIWASLHAFPLAFLAPIFPRILLLLATFAQPLLVSRMIGYISEPDPSSDKGWALVGAFVCVYGLIALMTSIYWEKVSTCAAEIRNFIHCSRYSMGLFATVADLWAVYTVNLSACLPVRAGISAVE
jgi:ATP-binding cassette subfamily C (CFTR/MRP) protein 1